MRILLALLPLLLPLPAAAFEIIDYGIYCPQPVDGEQVPAPGTELGWTRLGPPRGAFDLTTSVVPAEHLLGFGLVWRNPGNIDLTAGTVVLTHPPMGANGVTRQTFDVTLLPGQTNSTTWVFEFDYERVQGPWTRSLVVDGKTVWSQKISVIAPGSSAAVNAACFGSTPTS